MLFADRRERFELTIRQARVEFLRHLSRAEFPIELNGARDAVIDCPVEARKIVVWQ